MKRKRVQWIVMYDFHNPFTSIIYQDQNNEQLTVLIALCRAYSFRQSMARPCKCEFYRWLLSLNLCHIVSTELSATNIVCGIYQIFTKPLIWLMTKDNNKLGKVNCSGLYLILFLFYVMNCKMIQSQISKLHIISQHQKCDSVWNCSPWTTKTRLYSHS